MEKFPLNKVDYYDTFEEFLQGIVNHYGDKPAISYFTRNKQKKSYTYRELRDQVFALREMLCILGLSGKKIGIVGVNSYQWIVAYLAIASCGSVAICVDIDQSDNNIRNMLRLADADVAFVSSGYLDICKPLLNTAGGIEKLFLLDDGKDNVIVTLDELCRQGREQLADGSSLGDEISLSGDQTAAIIYTSGTTSSPKLVMLSHKNIMQNASDSVVYITTDDNAFAALPFYHTYGMTCAVLSMILRGTHLYINGDLKTMMRDLHLCQADFMVSVPLIIESLYNQIWINAQKAGKEKSLRKLLKFNSFVRRMGIPWQSKTLLEIRKKAVGNLHIIVSGGAHLSSQITRDFELFGVLILQGYGITECSPLIATNCNYSYRIGSVGHIVPSCQVKIVDEEIFVKGLSVMQGYYKNPQETAEVLVDGWFKTGDIGYMDKDGFLYLTGRKKNLIVFKNGKKISPETLEELIGHIPLVKEVLVYGATSGDSADDVQLAASIYPRQDYCQGMSSYEILEALQEEVNKINATLPVYQQVKMVNIREKEFAKTASQKIKRNLV